VRRVDLEPVGEDDHVLLPAAQPQESVRVDLAEIAGVIPTVAVEDRARRILVLPVALEHVRPMDEDLAVAGDADLDARDGDADRAEAIAVKPVERDRGRALRGAVSLEDVDAEVAPRLAERGVERRAARDDVAEAATELLVDAREEDPAHEHGQ